MFSVYTSLFNYSPEKFDILDAFSNWSKYAREIVIGTFPDQEDEILKAVWREWYNGSLILDNGYEKATINVVSCDTDLDDPLFDGKLKNAALQACKTDLVLQQDLDERIGGSFDIWKKYGEALLNNNSGYRAIMLPVIDLYKDYGHYKGIGYKWFLHLKEGCYRGVVNFAKKEGGLIDTDKSDTCELIDRDGNLVRFAQVTDFIKTGNINCAHIVHLGFLDLNKRAENNKFWKPHWENRSGTEADIATSIEQLEKNYGAIPHNFPHKWWV